MGPNSRFWQSRSTGDGDQREGLTESGEMLAVEVGVRMTLKCEEGKSEISKER